MNVNIENEMRERKRLLNESVCVREREGAEATREGDVEITVFVFFTSNTMNDKHLSLFTYVVVVVVSCCFFQFIHK